MQRRDQLEATTGQGRSYTVQTDQNSDAGISEFANSRANFLVKQSELRVPAGHSTAHLSGNVLKPLATHPTNHVTQPTAPPMLRAIYVTGGTSTETNDDSTDDGDTATTKYYYYGNNTSSDSVDLYSASHNRQTACGETHSIKTNGNKTTENKNDRKVDNDSSKSDGTKNTSPQNITKDRVNDSDSDGNNSPQNVNKDRVNRDIRNSFSLLRFSSLAGVGTTFRC